MVSGLLGVEAVFHSEETSPSTMFLADPTLSRPRDEADGLEGSIARATEALLKLQHADGHWVFDLEADPAIPAEYVMILHFLGERNAAVERGTGNYLRRRQEAHGGWPMLVGGGLISAAAATAIGLVLARQRHVHVSELMVRIEHGFDDLRPTH